MLVYGSLAVSPPPSVWVCVPSVTTDDWSEVSAELFGVYEFSQGAARAGEPLIYLVRTDDLLGRRGPGRAMVATGVLSAARTLALEMAKTGVPVNVLSVEEDTKSEAIDAWILHLSAPDGPTGEIVRLGSGHIGKALP